MEIFKESGILPWIVTVHFQSFPYERILKCGSSEESEKYYFHSLKQALYLLHGSTRPFNDLTSEKQSQLWESTYQGSMGMFEQVARDLRPSIENFKFIPLRILFAWDKATYQKPVALFDNDNTYLSVKSYLEPLIHTWEFASAYDILIQGIVVPDDMPLYQIWKLFAHADLFLYICVRPSVKLSS
jgi:autophagy-related protein 5